MSNIAVRNTAFMRTGGFDETMIHNEDLEWLIRLVGTGAHVVGINKCQTWYRTSRYGLSADLRAILRSPAGFFNAPRRGLATLAGALLAPVLSAQLSQHLFYR